MHRSLVRWLHIPFCDCDDSSLQLARGLVKVPGVVLAWTLRIQAHGTSGATWSPVHCDAALGIFIY